MYHDTKTAKDRLGRKLKISGIFGKRSEALKKKIGVKREEEAPFR